jgi:hypothetical protein
MTFEWIAIEIFAVLIENFVKIFFLNRQFTRKYDSHLPIVILWLLSVVWGLFATFGNISQLAYDVTSCIILFVGTFYTVKATLPRKLFVVILIIALEYVTTFAGAGVATLISKRTFNHTLYNQDASRLLAIVSIKMLQIVVFLPLSRKHPFKLDISRTPALVLVLNCVFCLVTVFLLWFFISSSTAESIHSGIIVAASVCSLLILVGNFVMYDLFSKLERRNIELSKKFQRADIETAFNNEIKAMHADLQMWRHEYKNNLIAIRGYVESEDLAGALEYLDSLAGARLVGQPLIRTKNPAIDAVVNSKLWLAQSRGIYVSAQSLFPEGGVARVTEEDLCSIIGNLLDNCIEACGRMPEGERKFINLELLVREYNLFLSIYNSYSGKILRDGEEYLTLKDRPYGGFGIKYVDMILAKYEGYAMREYNNGVFATQVMIPLLDPKGDYIRVTHHKWYNRILGNLRGYFGRR